MKKHALLVTLLIITLLPAVPITLAQGGDGYSEAPMLAAMVEAGELPPVDERLPAEPLVLEPYAEIGVYGGSWRQTWWGSDALMIRTVGYDGLVRWSPDWQEIIPNAAMSYDANDDATEFIFHLREGMKWSDGAPFTADDITFWYEAVHLNDELGLRSAWMQDGTVNKIDDRTVAFRFPNPNGLFLQQLASVEGTAPTIYPRHYFEQFHIDYNADGIDALMAEADVESWTELFAAKGGALYGGRWIIADRPTLNAWVTRVPFDGLSTQVIIERNPYYWKVDPESQQLPYLDRLVYTVAPDAEVTLLDVLAGKADFMTAYFNDLSNKPVVFDNQDRGNYHLVDLPSASTSTVVLSLNLTHPDPVKAEIYNNKDFRIALSHAINRQEIIDLLYLGQTTATQPAPLPGTLLYDEAMSTQYTAFDPALANEILDGIYPDKNGDGIRLGPDGEPISIILETNADEQNWIDIAELVKTYWADVGVELLVRPEERTLLYERKNANEHDAVLKESGRGTLQSIFIDPRDFMPTPNLEANFGIGWALWAVDPNDELAVEPPDSVKRQIELYEQIGATADPDMQIAMMQEILSIAKDEFFCMGISTVPVGYGIVRNDFHNVPDSMWLAWQYPTPAPTQPEQYFTTRAD